MRRWGWLMGVLLWSTPVWADQVVYVKKVFECQDSLRCALDLAHRLETALGITLSDPTHTGQQNGDLEIQHAEDSAAPHIIRVTIYTEDAPAKGNPNHLKKAPAHVPSLEDIVTVINSIPSDWNTRDPAPLNSPQ